MKIRVVYVSLIANLGVVADANIQCSANIYAIV